MPQRSAGFRLDIVIALGLFLVELSAMAALAEPVPFNCMILPGEDIASILITNSLDADASCIVTCGFQTTKYGNNPQITCAKPVPAGKQVEMCRLPPSGDKLVKLAEGHAECSKSTATSSEKARR